MDKIIVTGGAGFIGSSVADTLLQLGHHVLCIDNLYENYDLQLKKANLARLSINASFSFSQADICDSNALRDIFTTFMPDVIIHLAAIPGVAYSVCNPAIYKEVNVDGTKILLSVMNELNISRLVYSSSSSVYGKLPAPFREDMPLLPGLSPYAETKRQSEKIIEEHFRGNAVILRLFSVYGPNMRPDLAMALFTKKIRNHEPITIYGDGSAKRDYTFISDAIAAILKGIAYTKIQSNIFNISGENPISLLALLGALENNLETKAKLRFCDARPFESVCTHADLSKSHSLLGYTPIVDFYSGLKKTIPYLKQL